MARHKEFDVNAALDAAMIAFWAKGYDGTSLQDLEKATGLTRTSIYNAFGNKRRLFDTVVTHYQQTKLSRLVMLLDSGKNIQEGVRKMLNGALDMHFGEDTPGGCLVVLSILERGQHNLKSSELLEGIIQGIQKLLRNRLVDARKTGELDAGKDPAGLAGTISATMAGMMVMGKAGASKSALKKVVDTACQLLEA